MHNHNCGHRILNPSKMPKFTFISDIEEESDLMSQLSNLERQHVISELSIVPFEAHGREMTRCIVKYEAEEDQQFLSYVPFKITCASDASLPEAIKLMVRIFEPDDVAYVTEEDSESGSVTLLFMTSNENPLYINPVDWSQYVDDAQSCLNYKYAGENPMILYVLKSAKRFKETQIYMIPFNVELEPLTRHIAMLESKGYFVTTTFSDVLRAFGYTVKVYDDFFLVKSPSKYIDDKFYTYATTRIETVGDIPFVYLENTYDLSRLDFIQAFTYTYTLVLKDEKVSYAGPMTVASCRFDDDGVSFLCHNLEMYEQLRTFDYQSLRFTRVPVISREVTDIVLTRYFFAKRRVPSFVILDDAQYYVCALGLVGAKVDLRGLEAECIQQLLRYYRQVCVSMTDFVSLKELTQMSLTELVNLVVSSSLSPTTYENMLQITDPVEFPDRVRNFAGFGPYGYMTLGPLIGIVDTFPLIEVDLKVTLTEVNPYYAPSEKQLAEDQLREPNSSPAYNLYTFRIVYPNQTDQEFCTLVLPVVGKYSPENTLKILQRAIDQHLWSTIWSLNYMIKTSHDAHLTFTFPDELRSRSIETTIAMLESL